MNIPQEVELAYKLAFPELSQVKDLSEVIKTYDSNSLQGIVSGVKGKLFEIKYLDYLNNGLLPEGYTAELAASATNAKWDSAIKEASNRYVKSYAAYLTGGSLAALTGLWGVGIAASIGSSLLLSNGIVKFQKYRSL